jgi:hypothetical protein
MIRVHRVTGRERGLMVIGDATSLRQLAEGLAAGLTGKPEQTDSTDPELISEALPVRDLEQGIAFYLEPISGAHPGKPFGDSPIGKTIFFALAIIGLISVVQWLFARL